MRDLLLQALRFEEVERLPVWLMRQAGRYMPEYQALREKHSLWKMFHDPEIAAQVTLLPRDLLDVDAAILFSDILVLAEVFGLKIVFPEHGGPYVCPFIDSVEKMKSLKAQPVADILPYVAQTLKIVKPQIDVPLFGFSAGPFTLASYMIEGAGRASFVKTKFFIESYPLEFAKFLDKITDATIEYLIMQAKAGADLIQVFDSWANVLEENQFKEFCLPYLQKIVQALKKLSIPVIVFCRDSHKYVHEIASIGPSAISIDEKGDMLKIRQQLGPEVALQGNLSAHFLKEASRDMVIAETERLLFVLKGQKGLIMNLGHGVMPGTPLENVRVFVQTVQNFKA